MIVIIPIPVVPFRFLITSVFLLLIYFILLSFNLLAILFIQFHPELFVHLAIVQLVRSSNFMYLLLYIHFPSHHPRDIEKDSSVSILHAFLQLDVHHQRYSRIFLPLISTRVPTH